MAGVVVDCDCVYILRKHVTRPAEKQGSWIPRNVSETDQIEEKCSDNLHKINEIDKNPLILLSFNRQ